LKNLKVQNLYLTLVYQGFFWVRYNLMLCSEHSIRFQSGYTDGAC